MGETRASQKATGRGHDFSRRLLVVIDNYKYKLRRVVEKYTFAKIVFPGVFGDSPDYDGKRGPQVDSQTQNDDFEKHDDASEREYIIILIPIRNRPERGEFRLEQQCQEAD